MNNIAIILLNYNSWGDTLECLESLLKQELEDSYTIFIVDNSPSNESIENILDWSSGKKEVIKSNLKEFVFNNSNKPIGVQFFKEEELKGKELKEQLILIKAKENKGFSAGNNVVLKYLKEVPNKFDYIWLLNNDTIVKPLGIKNIISKIEAHKNEFILFGTPLMEYYEPNYIQAIGGKYNKFLGRPSLVGAGVRYGLEVKVQEYTVDYPIGASMILSTNSLQKLGLLSESYFLFFEELDWTTRIKKLGGNLKILNVFDVLHKQGSSTKQNVKTDYNVFMETLLIKNRLIYAKKHNRSNLIFIKLTIIFIVVPRKIYKGQFELAKAIVKTLLNQRL